MQDMAGEAIAAEVGAPSTFTIIRSLVEKSSGAILLVDAALAGAGSRAKDPRQCLSVPVQHSVELIPVGVDPAAQNRCTVGAIVGH